MAYINMELGIPLSGIHQGINFSNASGSGRGRRRAVKGILLVALPPAGAVYVALSQSDKKRYKDAMGSISNPPSNLIREYYSSTKSQFPFSYTMSSEQLESVINSLNAEYGRWDSDRDNKAGKVAKNRKAMDKGENKQTLAELAAVRAWMQAINDYRAEVVKAYDKAVALEEKKASQEEQQTTYPSPKPIIVGGTGVSLPPSGIEGGTSVSLSPTTNGTSTPTDGDNKPKTNMILLGFGGLVVVGALIIYFKK